MNNDVLNFVKEIYPIAKQMKGFNPEFVTAQGGLESGWGKKRVGKFNIFGIKAGVNFKGKRVLITTTEYHKTKNAVYPEVISITPMKDGSFKYIVKDWFCDFDSIEDCLEHHFDLLNRSQFAHAKQFKDNPFEYVTALQSGKYKYATSPDYVKLMFQIIKMVQNAKNILNL